MSQLDAQGRRVREVIPLEGMRKMIGERMAQSLQEYPQGTGVVFLDTTPLIKFKKELKEKGAHVTFGDIYAKLAACALEENMELNGSRKDGTITYYDSINLTVTASINGALMEPVLFDANAKDVVEISEELKKIYGYLQKGRLMKVPLEGGTFAVSNLGTQLIDNHMPFISPPQGGILGIGRCRRLPAFGENDEIIESNITSFSLTVDHGLVDGFVVTSFFSSLQKAIQDPWTYLFKKTKLPE